MKIIGLFEIAKMQGVCVDICVYVYIAVPDAVKDTLMSPESHPAYKYQFYQGYQGYQRYISI